MFSPSTIGLLKLTVSNSLLSKSVEKLRSNISLFVEEVESVIGLEESNCAFPPEIEIEISEACRGVGPEFKSLYRSFDVRKVITN